MAIKVDKKTERIYVEIGENTERQKIPYHLDKPPMLGILGSTNSGKTTFLQNLILSLARDFGEQVQFLGIDCKNGASLKAIKSRFYEVEIEPTRALTVLEDFELLLGERLKYISEFDDEHEPKIEVDDPQFPLVVLVVEELTTFMEKLTKSQLDKANSLFITITSRCRAANMGFIFSSQNFNKENALPTAARGNILEKVLMFHHDDPVVKAFEKRADEEAPSWELRGSGEFYFKELGTHYEHGKTWFLSSANASRLAHRYSVDVVDDLHLNWQPECPFADELDDL